jgi:kinesin family protein 4/21/27
MHPGQDINEALQRVANKEATMNETVGPAVSCLMATFGTNMISTCVFEFEDPEELR